MKSVNSDRVEVANKQGRYTQNYTHTQAKEIHVHARAYVCACDLQEKTLIRHVERETVASFINLCGLRCLARTLQTQFGI